MQAIRLDKETEGLGNTADLSKFAPSHLMQTKFEFEKKSAQLNMRVPKSLLEAVKKRSAMRGIPYTRFIREAVESALSHPEKLLDQ